jgi:high-affinity Fe2+/Pb2+ permease
MEMVLGLIISSLLGFFLAYYLTKIKEEDKEYMSSNWRKENFKKKEDDNAQH